MLYSLKTVLAEIQAVGPGECRWQHLMRIFRTTPSLKESGSGIARSDVCPYEDAGRLDDAAIVSADGQRYSGVILHRVRRKSIVAYARVSVDMLAYV